MYNNLDWLITKVKSITKEVSAIKTKLPNFKLDSDKHVYQINDKDISAKYDDESNDIADTYFKKYVGTAHADEYLVVGEDGYVTTKALEEEQ